MAYAGARCLTKGSALANFVARSSIANSLFAAWGICYLLVASAPIQAQLLVVGSPGYNASTGTGFRDAEFRDSPGAIVNNSGTAVGWANKYVSGSNKGSRAVRWDSSGTAVELDVLGTGSNGGTSAEAYAINDTGMAVGWVEKYVSGQPRGKRAVRWNASGTTATELGTLGTDVFGNDYAQAFAVNAAGDTVGWSTKPNGQSNPGVYAVRWDANRTPAEAMEHLAASQSNGMKAEAYAVNNSNYAVGWSDKHNSVSWNGTRAVSWNYTNAQELGVLGVAPQQDLAHARAYAINSSRTVVGYSTKCCSGTNLGTRAVRWHQGNTTPTELDILGHDGAGRTDAEAFAVNDTSVTVGWATKWVSGNNKGRRAVRWAAFPFETITELGNLGTADGSTDSVANGLNAAGTAVGLSRKYVATINQGNRAAIWLPDASVIDMNGLGIIANPNDGSWLLESAKSISADGWVAGSGTFTPNVGSAYTRLWVTQVGLGGNWTNAFTGNLNGTWGRGPQWSTGTPAMQVGNAAFNSSAAYTVSLDRNETTRSITVTAGDVAFSLNGYSLSTSLGSTVGSSSRLRIGSSGTATITGGLTNNGTLGPGTSVGTLNISGNYAQSSGGKLQVELASPTNFDRLQVNGNAALAGTLEVSLINGYMPAVGDSFDIFDRNSVSGSFTTLDLPDLTGGLQWDASMLYSSGIISVVGLEGDFNGDAAVDAADYVVWRKNGGSQADYNTWRSNFGRTAANGAGSNNTIVPEPATSIPILFAIMAMFTSRRLSRS